MKVSSNNFIPAAEVALLDDEMRASILKGTTNAHDKRTLSMNAAGPEHGEALRAKSKAAKRRVLLQLPDLLERAEANLEANGVRVLWASTGEEAREQVLEIARRHEVQTIVKSKSMVSEEVDLNHALEAAGMEVLETDLGEYIVQLEGETPSHIVAPIIHKSKQDVRDLFIRALNMKPTDDSRSMATFIREGLRPKYLQAEMGITGGNFIVADTGTLCIVTNEGNGRLVTSLPPVHVALVGIEKIVETMGDYATLTQVLPRSATGQSMTVYTHMYNGPRRNGESDGPEQMYVILVDNGRSRIYGTRYVEALACIRCGACMNACPVYRSTGGHPYGWVYPGPIGAVITPLLQGLGNAAPLPHASSLCGECKAVCPVDIDLPQMLLDLRSDLYEMGVVPLWLRLGIWFWKVGNRSPALFEFGGRFVRVVLGDRSPDRLPGPLAGWTKYRTFPSFAEQPFRREWRKRRGGP